VANPGMNKIQANKFLCNTLGGGRSGGIYGHRMEANEEI